MKIALEQDKTRIMTSRVGGLNQLTRHDLNEMMCDDDEVHFRLNKIIHKSFHSFQFYLMFSSKRTTMKKKENKVRKNFAS